MTYPRYTALVQSLPETVPFVGPEELVRKRGVPFSARLGANETVFGPSPKAIAALQETAPGQWMYGDSTSHDLRRALSEKLHCDTDNIVVGEGIDGLLGYLVRLLVAPGDAVVTSHGAYPTFNYHVAGYGGTLHKVPYKGDFEDLDGLLDKATQVQAKLIYLANPDNPMGSFHPGTRIEAALARLPEGCLLCLDEAYCEFAPDEARPKTKPADPRLIRLRTFSKAYGLAGARVGYAIGAAELIRNFDKIRNHFGMNRSAQAAALAALQDEEWLQTIRGKVSASRDQISAIAHENGLTALPSATNFVAVDCGEDGRFAGRVLEALLSQGLFVRMPFVAPQDRCIRISCGPPEDMARLARALPEALARARR